MTVAIAVALMVAGTISVALECAVAGSVLMGAAMIAVIYLT